MEFYGKGVHREVVGSLFSGLPKKLRDHGKLMVLQGWFDESGKGQEPVYLLAGYVAKKNVWEDFADDWQAELDRVPRLPYLHVNETQRFKGWSLAERTERFLRFVGIIKKHNLDGSILPLKHSDHREFYRIAATHPFIKPYERRMFKTPYFLAFQSTFGVMLSKQAKKRAETGITELIEILFDEGIDRKVRLERGFNLMIESVKREMPEYLDLLINKQAEFRDDEVFLPLQAADLLAWYVRRLCYEGARGKQYADPVWLALKEATHLEVFPYTDQRYVEVLTRVRTATLRALGLPE